jgi:hypothetical protein
MDQLVPPNGDLLGVGQALTQVCYVVRIEEVPTVPQ